MPPGATVILVSGLSGDVETETSYAQQMQSWLELLSGFSPPSQIVALCDDPGALPSPNPRVRISQATRENFLNIAKQLGSQTNSLVVIAWGHGGRQGSTPVLHVRGPRLTPDDFKTLAGQGPNTDSTWLLLFRNSGAFARALAGPHRQILASDNAVAFGSDPVSPRLLLNLVRSQRQISFDQLAEAFGHAVGAWYAGRNLARTEEPTLWLGDAPARALVTDSPHAVSENDKPPQPDSATAAVTPAPVAPRANDGDRIAAGWNDVQPVPAGNYPDNDAVILKQRLVCTLGTSPAVTTEQEQFIQVLTPDGKQAGDFDLAYDAPEEELEILDCEVRTPAGKILRLDPDEVAEARAPGVGDYQAGGRKFFSLPGITPGAIVHMRYRKQWKSFPLPHIALELPLVSDLPVAACAVVVNVPKDAAFHFGFRGLLAADPAVRQGSYSTSYTWQLKDLHAKEPESLGPPHQEARMLVSTFPDWGAFAQWYGRVSRLTAEPTPELIARAKELTRDAKSDREKVLALYDYVSRLRYVAIPLGVNSYRPHAAAHVLDSGFGDCKDKANLLNALLHTLQIPADLVLVPRFGDADESLPGLGFNHAISRINLSGQTFWADTTDEVCRFGLLPPGDPGRKVLVIDGKSLGLTQLPSPEPNQHQLKIIGKVACATSNADWPMTLSASALGYPDYMFREITREAHSNGRPLLASRYRPVAGAFALDKQSSTAASALEQSFQWKAEGSVLGLTTRLGTQQVVHAPFWLPNEWFLALHSRRTSLFLNQGYPLLLDEDFELALPEGAKATGAPPSSSNTEPPLRWKVEWTTSAAGKVSARLHAELLRGEIASDQTATLQHQLRSLFSALSADAAFSNSEK